MGTVQTITWSNTSGDAGPDVRLGLHKGAQFVNWIVRRTENDGAYNWIVWTDIEAGDNYHVRVQSYENSAYNDYSDGLFSIELLGVKQPNGGEAWVMGNVYAIEWGSHDTLVGPDVRLGLHFGAEFVDWIVRKTDNDGRYYWKIPADLTEATSYRIRVQSYADNTIRDFSDSLFSLSLPPLWWTSPGFQDELTAGQAYEVTWDSNDPAVGPNVRIGLHKGGQFVDWMIRRTANDGSWNWLVPTETEPAFSYRLRLQSYADNNLRTMSPAFVISTP